MMAEAAGFMDNTEYEYLADRFVRLPRRSAIVCTSGHEPFSITATEFAIALANVDAASLAAPDAATTAAAAAEEDADEITFLESIESEPFISVRRRRASLGWNDKRYYNAVDSLILKKKIEVEKARVGRGTPTILYQKIWKIPSVRHQYYVNWIVEKIKEEGFNYTTNILEGPDIEIPNIRTVIEIELGKSDMHSNIARNVKKFDKVIVCSDNKKLLQTLSAQNKSNKVLFSQIENVPALIGKMPALNELENI